MEALEQKLIGKLIGQAEANIQAAIQEGGLSPAHERMIDALEAIVQVLKVGNGQSTGT